MDNLSSNTDSQQESNTVHDTTDSQDQDEDKNKNIEIGVFGTNTFIEETFLFDESNLKITATGLS